MPRSTACAVTPSPRNTSDSVSLVWPIAVGLGLGRVGCFLAGLHDDTVGLPTVLPWGVDFGDGVAAFESRDDAFDLAEFLEGGERLYIWGDVVHMPEVQVPRPEVP